MAEGTYALIAPYDGEALADIDSVTVERNGSSYRYSGVVETRNEDSKILPTVLLFERCDQIMACGGTEVEGE